MVNFARAFGPVQFDSGQIVGRPQADDFAVRQAEQRVINQACSNSGAGGASLGIMTVK
jgi:hypothetical protein